MGAAYDYYKTGGWKFMGESKLEFGWFVLGSGLLDVEDINTKDELGVIQLRVGTGVLLKYSYSWTVRWVLLGMPMYLTMMLSIKAGCEFSHELAFSWINGEFHNWSFKPFKDITIVFGISFTATLGFGIKGFLEGWLRFVAGIEIRLYLAILSQEKSMLSGYGFVNATLGVTVFFTTASVTFWETGGNLFGPIPLGNAAPPLQQYALANAEPEEQRAIAASIAAEL